MKTDHPLMSMFENVSGLIRFALLNADHTLAGSHYIPTSNLSAFPQLSPTDKHVFFHPVTRSHRHGRKESSSQTRCLWVDIDDPEAFDHAVATCGLKPSIIVHSGSGGGHLYWVLERAINVGHGSRVATIFEQALKQIAYRLGGDMSVTHTAANMRLPGSLNIKHSPAVPVIWEQTGHVHPLSVVSTLAADYTRRIGDACGDITGEGDRKPHLSADTVIEQCPAMQFAAGNPNAVSENEWFAMLRCLVAFPDGNSAGQQISSGYSDYTSEETDKKLCHAARYNPAGCSALSGFGQCSGCSWRNIVSSPAGIPYKMLKTSGKVVNAGR